MDYVVIMLIMNFIFYCGHRKFVECEFFIVFEFKYSLVNFFVVTILVRSSILFLSRIVIFNHFRVE